MTVIAAAVGAASGAVGLVISAAWDIAAGGAIALTATMAFAASVMGKRVVQAQRAQTPTRSMR
jgi:manganese/iron transport system permease protein